MPYPYQNLAASLVATAPSPATSGTSVTVTATEGALFANPATAGAYPVTLWPDGTLPTALTAEIALVTAKSGDVLTITRAQESTTARSVATGWRIAASLTKAMMAESSGMLFPVSFTAFGLAITSLNFGSPNRCFTVVNAGTSAAVTKIGFHVVTSLGNIDVGVISCTGAPAEGIPVTRKASTGSIACPAAGYAEVSLAVTINRGDHFALANDTGTANFLSCNSGNYGSNFFKGMSGFADGGAAFPIASTLSAWSPTPQRVPIMKGI